MKKATIVLILSIFLACPIYAASQKVSEMTDGSASITSVTEVPVVRGGANEKVTVEVLHNNAVLTATTATTGIDARTVTLNNGSTPNKWTLTNMLAWIRGKLDSVYQALDADLTSLAGQSGTGISARTTSNTWTTRTITGTSNEITVTNGDGVSGNPTIELPASILIGTGHSLAVSGTGTIEATSIKDVAAANPYTMLHSTDVATPYAVMGLVDANDNVEMRLELANGSGVGYTWNSQGITIPSGNYIKYLGSLANTTGLDSYSVGVNKNDDTTTYKYTFTYLWAWIKAKIESVAIALANGTTATTQTAHSNDTGVATNAYVDSEFTIAGTSLTAGYAYYMTTAGALAPANATSAATLPSPAVCVAVSTTACRKCGKRTTTGLTAGSVYYVPVGGGAVTTTVPSASGNQVQRIGVASSEIVLEIMPSLDVFTVQ